MKSVEAIASQIGVVGRGPAGVEPAANYESAALTTNAQMVKGLEPTIGLEPMTCRLRIDCSTN